MDKEAGNERTKSTPFLNLNFLDSLKDFALYSTALTTAGLSYIDFYMHFVNTEARHSLGTVFGNHIGNWGYMAAFMVASGACEEGLTRLGEKYHSEMLLQVARQVPIVAVAVAANITFFFELTRTFNNDFRGDVSMGLLAIGTTLAATKLLSSRYRHAADACARYK